MKREKVLAKKHMIEVGDVGDAEGDAELGMPDRNCMGLDLIL